jgi:hypothetical protein
MCKRDYGQCCQDAAQGSGEGACCVCTFVFVTMYVCMSVLVCLCTHVCMYECMHAYVHEKGANYYNLVL